jgi:hypothetical protein
MLKFLSKTKNKEISVLSYLISSKKCWVEILGKKPEDELVTS